VSSRSSGETAKAVQETAGRGYPLPFHAIYNMVTSDESDETEIIRNGKRHSYSEMIILEPRL
jgi:hypothetical protein